MRLRVLRLACISCAVLFAAQPGQAYFMVGGLEEDGPDETCAVVYKGRSNSGPGAGVTAPGDPLNEPPFFYAEFIAPETRYSNGTRVAFYASPEDCV